MFCSGEQKDNIIFNFQLNREGSEDELFAYGFYSNKGPLSINKAYRPNAHLLYTEMHYNGNII